jgi:hypothetical protein
VNERKNASGTVTIVTGPVGVDVGAVAARLGQGLGDGLAIRTIADGPSDRLHTSPNPHYASHIPGQADSGGYPGGPTVELAVLPSAWQNPDTNLGVAWVGPPSGLYGDLQELDRLGLHPGHRITVQYSGGGNVNHGHRIPAPVEVGDLAVQARDSVLRTGGRVLVEAGDGQTAQDALHTVGLPPWSAHIGRLDIWIVLDASRYPSDQARTNLIADAATEVLRNGGPFADPDDICADNLWLAVTNAHTLPGLEGLTGFDSVVSDDELERQLEHGSAMAVALGELLDEFRDKTGTFPMLLGTGWPPSGPTYFDLLGDHDDRPTD